MRKSIQLRDYEVRSLERNRRAKVVRVVTGSRTPHLNENHPILLQEQNIVIVIGEDDQVITGTQLPFSVGSKIAIDEPVDILQVPILNKHMVQIGENYVNVIRYTDGRCRLTEPNQEAEYWDNRVLSRTNKPQRIPARSFQDNFNRFTCEVSTIKIGRLQDFTKDYTEVYNLGNYVLSHCPNYGEPKPGANWTPMNKLSNCSHDLDKACAKMWNKHTKREWLQYAANPIVYCYDLKLIQDAKDYLRPLRS